MNTNIKKNQGFSLIELMVVVAIIGILATIAVPNFQKFQARSKQTNAKAELSAIYTAQKSFFAEYSTYSTFLHSIGFTPEGLQAASVGSFSVIAGVKRYYAPSGGPTTAADWGNLTGTVNVAVQAGYVGGYLASSNLCDLVGTNPLSATAAAAVTGGVAVGQDTFSALTQGCPMDRAQTAATRDVWWIDNNRVMRNAQNGLN